MTRITKILGGSGTLTVLVLGIFACWPHSPVHSPSQHTSQASSSHKTASLARKTATTSVSTPTHSPHLTSHVSDLPAEASRQPHHTVAVPWLSHTPWAFVPQAVQGTLWFGQKSGSAWHWIPSVLPAQLSRQLPLPVYDALQWADDLHANQPGPKLPGTISWSGIAGQVGEPVGWTVHILSANQSPIGGQTLALTIWVPSETGMFHGVYGLETVWNAHNAHTGQGALLMLVAAKHVPSERR